MYANDYNSHYDDDYRRFGQSESYYNRQWYQHDNERVSVSEIFERSDIHNRNRHASDHSYRSTRRRSVRRYRRTRRIQGRHRSESSDRSSRKRSVKRNRHHRRTRRTHRRHRSENSDRSGRRRSVKRHHRRTRRTESRDKKHRNRKRSHSRRYRRCHRSVERSRRHRRRYYCRCSSRSSSAFRSGYSDRCPTRRDRYRYIYDRGGSGGCDRYETCNNCLRCGDERHEMRKGNEVPWQTATLQRPISTFTQMPVPTSTQPDAYMPNDCRHHYSQIHPNLADYAYRVPAVYPSGMDSQLCPAGPAPSTVDDDMLPSIAFISEMLKNDCTNFVDSTAHNSQRIDQSNVLETTENTLHIEPENNDEDNAVGLMDCNSGGNDIIPLNDDFVNADGDMEAHNLRRCFVKLQQVQHPSTLSNQGTREGAKLERSPQEDCEQMAGMNEMRAVPTSTVKNNNPNWHSLDDKIDCKICKIKFKKQIDVVRHYNDYHPNYEVFPSRVAPDIAELLRDPKLVHNSKRIEQRRTVIFKQQCYFCNTSVSKEKRAWITHMARHTGYYRDKCTRCSKKFMRHRSQYCVDNGYVVREQSQRRFEQQFQNDDVFAYLCNLCNYVRFDKAEIKKHLNRQHDGDTGNSFKKVIFLRFPNGRQKHQTATELNESQLRIEPRNNQEDDKQHVEAIIKNNNPDWHCLSLNKRCKICSRNIRQSLVCHYASVHPNSEVIPSRVAPDVGRFLRSLKYTAKCKVSAKRNAHSMYKQYCYFCNQLKCCTKSSWIGHMIRHSGYYKFQCVGCSKKFVKPSEHVCDDSRNLKILQQPRFDGENLIAYLCDICNFVRFDKSDIENHLRNEHEGNDTDDYEEIIFLSFPTDKRDDKAGVNDETNAEDVIEGTNNGNFTPPLMEKERIIAEASTVTTVDIVPEMELSSTTNENWHTSSPKEMENLIDANGWDTCSSDFLE